MDAVYKGCLESVKHVVAWWLAEGVLEHEGVGSSGGLRMPNLGGKLV